MPSKKPPFPWPLFVAAGGMGFAFWYLLFREGEHQDGSDLWHALGFPYGPIGNLPSIGSDFRTGPNRVGGKGSLPTYENIDKWHDVFNLALPNNASGWATFNVRTLIPAAQLTSVNGSVIRVTFAIFQSNSGILDSAWVGQQGSGNPYNFDGTQKQLMFSGKPSFLFPAGNVTNQLLVSDPLQNFSFSSTVPLIVSMHWNASGSITSNNIHNIAGAHSYFLAGADVSSQTAPAGAWGDENTFIEFINHVEYATLAVPALGGLTDTTGATLTDITGTVLTDIGGTPYAALYPSRNAAGINIGGNPSGSPPP